VTVYADKLAQLTADLAAMARSGGGPASVGIARSTSNLFRDRAPRRGHAVDLAHFNELIEVDRTAGVVRAEGMIRYVDLVDATLAHSAMPAVVPQLKSITLGGAVAGVGIESSSFRHGLVHDAIVALDVLTGDGRIVTCTADNAHRDLFFGLPNSYGTLGYALAVTTKLVAVKPFVALTHVRYRDADACFAAVAQHCAEARLDFLDGTAFAPDEIYLTLGRFADTAPYASDYTFDRIYYRSIRERGEDFLSIRDYLWRWDTDWFWCSKNVGAQHPLLRRLLGRERLNSITYQKIMRWNAHIGASRAWDRLRGMHSESVIQDVDIPLDRAAEFLAFLHADIGIRPIWICPIRVPAGGTRFPLYPLPAGTVYVNFGFWDAVTGRTPRPAGHFNRLVERKVADLGGLKSLYSDSYYTEDEFRAAYGGAEYAALKARYDPDGRQGDLYAKCVTGGRAP
jgi:FAD/FMN-containing dehydrogenase